MRDDSSDMTPDTMKTRTVMCLLSLSCALCLSGPGVVWAESLPSEHLGVSGYNQSIINIRNPNGKFYAYVVLLFNENPHFVNLIQEGRISLKTMQKEGFHVVEYRNYLNNLRDPSFTRLAKVLFEVYFSPEKYTQSELAEIESDLSRKNIVMKFSRPSQIPGEKPTLDYCIYGKKILIDIVHPLFHSREKIYNIQPFIYYDEFSTSNSTFYYDMIYINPEEVHNDSVIARKVILGQNVDSMYFVGSRITEDIKYCLVRAFPNILAIKREIWRMFVIHELTHKILNNRFNSFDQITGEELSLCSTIFANPYLGISVLFSYLDYNVTNPHRNAAMNYIRYIATATDKPNLVEYPSLLKYYPVSQISRLTKDRFDSLMKSLGRQ